MFIESIQSDMSLRIKKIASCGESMFAIATKGEIFAWGNNENGQLGIGYKEQSY
jgi:alpha-tubulin suppressor-like RCC1 family protein